MTSRSDDDSQGKVTNLAEYNNNSMSSTWRTMLPVVQKYLEEGRFPDETEVFIFAVHPETGDYYFWASQFSQERLIAALNRVLLMEVMEYE